MCLSCSGRRNLFVPPRNRLNPYFFYSVSDWESGQKKPGFMITYREQNLFLSHHSCYLTVHCSHSDLKLEEQIIQRLIDDGVPLYYDRAISSKSTDFFLNHIRNGIHFVFWIVFLIPSIRFSGLRIILPAGRTPVPT